jgi:hypothetical protein
MSAFVSKCLATSDPKRAIQKRCKNIPSNNGLLCDECLRKAQRGPIHILMHKEVTRKYGVKFHGQLTVTIDLSKAIHKPQSRSAKDEDIRNANNRCLEALNKFTLSKLRALHDSLRVNVWKDSDFSINPYAARYNVTKAIIQKLRQSSE